MKKRIIILVVIYSLTLVLPPGSLAQDTTQQQAITAYNQGNFAKAAPLLQTLVQKNPQDDAIRSKYAYALLMLQKYPQARREFTYIVQNSKNKRYIDYARQMLQTMPAEQLPQPSAKPSSLGELEGNQAHPENGAAIPQVKKMLRQLQQEDKLANLSPYFSNESAATIGLVLVMLAGFIVVMSPEPQQTKLEKQLNAILLRYDLEAPDQKQDAMDKQKMAKLAKKGRQFMKEIALFLDANLGSQQAKLKENQAAFKQFDINALVFKQVSPLKVEFWHPKDKQIIAAVFEDGQWRLHVVNLEELMQKGAQSPQLPK